METLILEKILCPQYLGGRFVHSYELTDGGACGVVFLIIWDAGDSLLPNRYGWSCVTFKVGVGAIVRVDPPVQNIEVVGVDM